MRRALSLIGRILAWLALVAVVLGVGYLYVIYWGSLPKLAQPEMSLIGGAYVPQAIGIAGTVGVFFAAKRLLTLARCWLAILPLLIVICYLLVALYLPYIKDHIPCAVCP